MKKKCSSFYFLLICCQLMILNFTIFRGECATSSTLEVGRGQTLALDKDTTEIFVANPEIADVQLNTPSVAYLFGKKPGTTTVFATDGNGKITVKMDVIVTHNLSELHNIVHQSFPSEKVSFFSIPQGILIQGEVKFPIIAKHIEEITKKFLGPKDEVINNISISNPTQVLLKVKIAEVSRTALNKLNINWSAMFSSAGKFTFGFLTGSNPLNQAVSSTSPNLFANNNTATNLSNGIGFQFADGVSNFTSLIDALNQEGLASILAEPNLIALSGETASFLSGGEFPYPVPQDQNITIEFKQFGVNLSFTPTVSSNNLIHLKVRPEVSQIDQTNSINITLNSATQSYLTVPAIKTRRAETSVQLGSGQSLAIAGLIQSDLANTFHELPGFADLPIIGSLFRSSAFQKNQSELVIIVTPYLIEPVSDPTKLKLPTDSLKYASNLEMFFYQRLNRVKDGNAVGERFVGQPQPVEFVGAAGFTVLD